jgi:tRNA C32,U32 (ribose-2'-O)-methylase TrmJ
MRSSKRPVRKQLRDPQAANQQLQRHRARYKNIGAFVFGREPNRGFL